MPSGKARDFDDTWRKEDLEKSIKDSRRSHKDGERRHRDNDDKRLRRKDDEDRRHRDKDTGDSDRKHRSSRHRDEEDGERRHRKHKEENGENKDEDRERRHRRHREETDEDRESRHRRHRDRENGGEVEDDKKDSRHHKDDETEEEKRRRKERERGHREEEGERKHRGEEDRERRHRSDRDRDDRRNKDDDEERRRRHEEKRRTEKEREREEKERERQLENERQREKERERQREIEKQREREKRKGSEREREKTKERKREPEPEVEEKGEDYFGDLQNDHSEKQSILNQTFCVRPSLDTLNEQSEISLDDFQIASDQSNLALQMKPEASNKDMRMIVIEQKSTRQNPNDQSFRQRRKKEEMMYSATRIKNNEISESSAAILSDWDASSESMHANGCCSNLDKMVDSEVYNPSKGSNNSYVSSTKKSLSKSFSSREDSNIPQVYGYTVPTDNTSAIRNVEGLKFDQKSDAPVPSNSDLNQNVDQSNNSSACPSDISLVNNQIVDEEILKTLPPRLFTDMDKMFQSFCTNLNTSNHKMAAAREPEASDQSNASRITPMTSIPESQDHVINGDLFAGRSLLSCKVENKVWEDDIMMASDQNVVSGSEKDTSVQDNTYVSSDLKNNIDHGLSDLAEGNTNSFTSFRDENDLLLEQKYIRESMARLEEVLSQVGKQSVEKNYRNPPNSFDSSSDESEEVIGGESYDGKENIEIDEKGLTEDVACNQDDAESHTMQTKQDNVHVQDTKKETQNTKTKGQGRSSVQGPSRCQTGLNQSKKGTGLTASNRLPAKASIAVSNPSQRRASVARNNASKNQNNLVRSGSNTLRFGQSKHERNSTESKNPVDTKQAVLKGKTAHYSSNVTAKSRAVNKSQAARLKKDRNMGQSSASIEKEAPATKKDFTEVYSQMLKAVVSDKHSKNLPKCAKTSNKENVEMRSARNAPDKTPEGTTMTAKEDIDTTANDDDIAIEHTPVTQIYLDNAACEEISEKNTKPGDYLGKSSENYDITKGPRGFMMSPKMPSKLTGNGPKLDEVNNDVIVEDFDVRPASFERQIPSTSSSEEFGQMQSPIHVSMATGTEDLAEEQEEDGIGDYEDDFEDYDDDFEDDEEDEKLPPPTSKTQAPKSRTEIDEVKAAMDEENDRLLRESKPRAGGDDSDDSFEAHRPSRRRHDDEEDSRKSWGRPTIAHRSFINFTSAQQRHLSSQVASKARRRALDLMQNIELDIARFDLFDMPPVSEYELYMRTFGGSNTKQAYVQTNEDNMDRDIQTEEVESTEKWSQHPQESLDCVGGPDDDKKKEEDSVKPIDQVKLGRFLQFAAHTMLVLLEEDRAFAASLSGIQGGPQQQSDLCLSQAFSQLNTSKVEALKGRHVVHSCFSPSQSQMLLTLHSQPDTASSGVLCVWNVIEPEKPQKLLLTESRPGCCCFSPIKAHLAFAGMHDGSLAVWDLRETSALHTTVKGLTLRYPTYSTAGVLHYDNHLSPVIAVQPIVTQAEGEGSSGSSEHGGDNLNFQLISLEENCTINLWVVADIGHPDLAGLQSDLGLNPGGRVKLIKSSTISLQNPLRDRRLRSTMHAHSLGLLPSNNSHFYVTTNVGCVCLGVRYGGKASPSVYWTEQTESLATITSGCVCHGVRYGGKASPSVYWTEQTESLATITSVDFSPFQIPVFLTGSADGSVRLYRTELDQAIVTWPDATQGNPVTCVRWCRSRPSVFFVLDASATVHIWDLLMNDAVPMKQEQIASKRVTSFELSNDHSATGLGMPGRKPQIVVSLEDGTTEIHTVKQEFSAFMSEELQRFNNLLLSYS